MIEIGDLAMDDAAVYITLISLITASLIFLFNYWRRLPTNAHPPYVSGLPLFGNAFQVFLEGANFVHECKSKFGDAFTLRLVGQKMTFIFAPKSLIYFFTAPDDQLTFAPAVQQFTERVFGLPQQHFAGKHYTLLSTLRHQLVPATLEAHGSKLYDLFLEELETAWPFTTEKQPKLTLDLFTSIRTILFSAAVKCLFGSKFVERHGIENLQTHFITLDECFEMAASPVPHFFQNAFTHARSNLLKMLKESHQEGDFDNTIVDVLIHNCELPESAVPNMLLAVLWASQANTAPAAFWSVALLLLPENTTVKDDIVSIFSSSSKEESTSLKKHILEVSRDKESLPTLCVLEAVRLRSPSIDVRIAASDLSLPLIHDDDTKLLTITKNTVVAISPYESHTDPRLYDEPLSFNPRRDGMKLDSKAKAAAMHSSVVGVGGLGGLSFGGGKYRCPGRSFAEMELAMLISMILVKYDVNLVPAGSGTQNGHYDGRRGFDTAKSRGKIRYPGDASGLLPPPDVSKLVGIKVPKGACWVEIQKRH